MAQDMNAPAGYPVAGFVDPTVMSEGSKKYQGENFMPAVMRYDGDQYGGMPNSPVVQTHTYEQGYAYGMHPPQYVGYAHPIGRILPGPPQATYFALGDVAAATVVRCYYGIPCSHLTEEDIGLKIRGVREHLQNHHYYHLVTEQRDGSTRLTCQWAVDGRACGRDVSDLHQLAKHVCTTHLKLFEVHCLICDKPFSQQWCLTRHNERYNGKCR